MRCGRRLELGLEEGGIALQAGAVIPLGIRRDEYHLASGGYLLQRRIDAAQIRQRGRTDIRAVGAADEQKAPVSRQVGRGVKGCASASVRVKRVDVSPAG